MGEVPDRLARALDHAIVRACECCGDEAATLHRHHIIPRSSGGGEGRENIAYICYECHRDIHRNLQNRIRIPTIPHDPRFDEYNVWGLEGGDPELRLRSYSAYRVSRLLRVQELQYEGFTYRQIASELGVSRTQVQKDCRDIEQLLRSTEAEGRFGNQGEQSRQSALDAAQELRGNRNDRVAARREAVAEILRHKPFVNPWFVHAELAKLGFNVSIATVRNDVRRLRPA